MRHFVHNFRRCLAAVGMLALVLAYLPGVVCLLNVAPACCTGTMCPMHSASGSHMTCGTDMAHLGAAFQTCGCHSAQYTGGGSVFDRVAPPAIASERFAGAAPAFLQIAAPSWTLEIVSPPPRFALS